MCVNLCDDSERNGFRLPTQRQQSVNPFFGPEQLDGFAPRAAEVRCEVVLAAVRQTSGDFYRSRRITAQRDGDKFMGVGRLYPSPVFHDVNGDGALDIVVGDLPGFLTVALRKPGADRMAFGPETRLKDFEGKDLKFHNW